LTHSVPLTLAAGGRAHPPLRPPSTASDVSIAPRSRQILASASYDSHIHLQFDDPDGDWCIFQKLHPKLPASSLTLPSPSASLRAALEPSAEDKAVEALNVPPLEEDETVWSLGWSPCGRYLASGGDLGGIRIWQRT